MLPTFDTSSTINLLDLLPESVSEGCNEYSLEEYTLQTCPPYYVLDYLPVLDDDHSSSILINGEERNIETTLEHALSHWVNQGEVRKLWIQSLALDPLPALSPKQLSRLQKYIRVHAEKVIVWIGRDHEDDDVLTGYLGSGSASSTKSAFGVCRSIASIEDLQEDLRPWFEIKAEHSQRAMWCHLANLLYRPWFRELPLLKTNYLDEIPSLLVMCGTTLIEWACIRVASERVRMIEPIPHLLVEDFEEVFTSVSRIKKWLEARENFGISTIHTMFQAAWLVKKIPQGHPDTDAQIDNVTAFVGAIDESSGMNFYLHLESIRDGIKREDTREHAPITLASLQSPAPLPTLPIQQAMIPPPDPEYQAPYVHKPMDYGAVTLLKLFPHGNNPDALVQGTLITAPWKDAPSFLYVLNATLKNYRRNSLILVDGQSFLVPEALDIFLRRVRDTKDERLLYIWKICMKPDVADVPGDPESVRAHVKYMTIAQRLQSISAGCIDMYKILTEAAEEVVHNVDGASDEYDWLLDLLDEEQVLDAPVNRTDSRSDQDPQTGQDSSQVLPLDDAVRVQVFRHP